MTDDQPIEYSWVPTFQDLQYQADKRGQNETEFSTCLKCLEEGIKDFNKESMVSQGKAFGITVLFVPCEEHDGITK